MEEEKGTPQKIEVPGLLLNSCTVGEHCRFLRQVRKLPYWWYKDILGGCINYTLPFQDTHGSWWYQVRPGFCLPVELYTPIVCLKSRLPFKQSYIGYLHVTPDHASANGCIALNTVLGLKNYGPGRLSHNRRSKVRSSFKKCSLEVFTEADLSVLEQCRTIWCDLRTRSGWGKKVSPGRFHEEWRIMLDCPGQTIILAREKTSGVIAGFLITKILGDTLYCDTIAVHKKYLRLYTTHALFYAALVNAARMKGVVRAFSGIRSHIDSLERFKQGMGFSHAVLPTQNHWTCGVLPFLKRFSAIQYNRIARPQASEVSDCP